MPLRFLHLLGGALPLVGVLGGAAAAPQAELPGSATVEETSTSEPAIVEIPVSPRHTRWFGQATVGMAYRWAFGESMMGAALDGELGAQSPRMAGSVRLHIEAGRMFAGLPYQVVTFGPNMWLRVHDRIRVGGGIDGGALLINRRTMPGHSMWTVLLGGHVGGSVELWRVGPTGALLLDATLGAYALTTAPGPASVLTTVALGYRP